MKMLRQIIRGCTDLPHVGEHPGTMMLIGFIGMGSVAGSEGGLLGAIGGASIMTIFMLPIYLYGAYDRANLSDQLVGKEGGESNG